jgi:hypothetical protein
MQRRHRMSRRCSSDYTYCKLFQVSATSLPESMVPVASCVRVQIRVQDYAYSELPVPLAGRLGLACGADAPLGRKRGHHRDLASEPFLLAPESEQLRVRTEVIEAAIEHLDLFGKAVPGTLPGAADALRPARSKGPQDWRRSCLRHTQVPRVRRLQGDQPRLWPPVDP